MRRAAPYACIVAGLAAIVVAFVGAFTASASNATFTPVTAVLAMTPAEAGRAAVLQMLARRLADHTIVGYADQQTAVPAAAIIVHDAYDVVVVKPPAQFRAFTFQPSFVAFGAKEPLMRRAHLIYRGVSLPVTVKRYARVRVRPGARVVAWLSFEHRLHPYAIARGNVAVMDGVVSADGSNGDLLVNALQTTILDAVAFHQFHRNGPSAQIVFSGVGGSSDPITLWRAVRLMASKHAAYAIVADPSAFSDDEIAAVLRYAVEHGAQLAPYSAERDEQTPWTIGDLGAVDDFDTQLATARALRFCSVCTASGEIDPQYVRLKDLSNYVTAMQHLGYRFEGGL